MHLQKLDSLETMRKKNQLLQSKLQALQDAKAAKRKLKVGQMPLPARTNQHATSG